MGAFTKAFGNNAQHGAMLKQDANALGFLPTNTASQNVTAWNALKSGIVNITTPGVYDINSTLLLNSNTTYNFCEGCTIRKTGDKTTYLHIFLNRGALTYSADSNIKFFGHGLRLMVNGLDDTTLGIVRCMFAQFQFHKVTNFIVDGYYINDGGTYQFLMSLSDCRFGFVTNTSFYGNKDCFKMVACSDITVDQITTSSRDDGISICANDYLYNSPSVGDCERISISNWTDNPYVGGLSNAILFLQDSWSDFVSGATYVRQETISNNGRIYKKTSPNASNVSTVAPTHTTGSVTGADGITWRWYADSTVKSVTVRDITLTNVSILSNRNFIGFDVDTLPANKAGLAKMENIVIDNLTFNPATAYKSIIRNSGRMGTVTLKNSNINPSLPIAVYSGVQNLKVSNMDNLIIDNSTIGLSVPYSVLGQCDNNALIGMSKYTITNSTVNTSTSNGALFGPSRTGQFTDVVFTDVIFNSLFTMIAQTAGWTQDMSILATRCSFRTPRQLLGINNNPGNVIKFTSRGCTYETPTLNLFTNGNVGSSLTIDVAGSIGTPTPSKVKGTNVTVIALDLPIV